MTVLGYWVFTPVNSFIRISSMQYEARRPLNMSIFSKQETRGGASRRKGPRAFLLTLGAIVMANLFLSQPVFAKGGYHYVALRLNHRIGSVYIVGTGYTNSPNGPHVGNISACYSYDWSWGKNMVGRWAVVGRGFTATVNQLSSNRTNPQFRNGSRAKVLTFSSTNCTDGLLKSMQATVPGGDMYYWWLDLR
jgi:hypothetical protein